MVMFYEVVTNAFMELGKCLCDVTFDSKDDDGLVTILCADVILEGVANANLCQLPFDSYPCFAQCQQNVLLKRN